MATAEGQTEEQDLLLDELGLTDEQIVEALEGVDVRIPEEMLLEVMAGQLQEHLKEYHATLLAGRAARSVGDQSRATQLNTQAAYHRLAAALIQFKHPGAKEAAGASMKIDAAKVKANREKERAKDKPVEV